MRVGWMAGVLAAGLCVSAAAPVVDSGGSNLAYRMMFDSKRLARNGRYSDAVARMAEVVQRWPDFAEGFLMRSNLLADAGRYPEALDDLNHVEAMHPNSVTVHIARAVIALRQRDGAGAEAYLAKAAAAPQAERWKNAYGENADNSNDNYGDYRYVSVRTASYMFAYLSLADELQGKDDAALDALKDALRNETVYPQYVLSRHCYIAGAADLLEMAELTCSEAIDKQTHDNGVYDSRGFVYLKMHQWDKAIADYDKAIYRRPDLTLSLYGRGIARRAKGDTAGGNADIAAATKDEPDIANIMARLGVKAQ